MASTKNTAAPQSRIYKELGNHEHVLLRPDMYIGTKRTEERTDYISPLPPFANGGGETQITSSKITSNIGLERIFIEVLSNSIDNVWRSAEEKANPSTFIKIELTRTSACISNDGGVVPIERQSNEGRPLNEGRPSTEGRGFEGGEVYKPEMVFGRLLTSSNYNDEEKRRTSGRNGLGVKLTNIYSTTFEVTIIDGNRHQKYVQSWRNNMKVKGEPVITSSNERNLVQIKWTPDFKYFELTEFPDSTLSLFRKYAFDCAMITGIPVSFSCGVGTARGLGAIPEVITINQISDYALLYEGVNSKEVIPIRTKECELALTSNFSSSGGANKFRCISFVNGCPTPLGGCHIDPWIEAIFRPIVEKINSVGGKKSGAGGRPKISIKDVKSYFTLFVNASLDNPEFKGQNKDELKHPTVTPHITASTISTLMKWDFVEKIEEEIRLKQFLLLKRNEAKKKGYTKVENLEHANEAGGKRAGECVLIIIEGNTAQQFALRGIAQGAFGLKGRDFFGIYTIRGKFLNCRKATFTQLDKNKIAMGIVKALGLQFGADYSDDRAFSALNYGRLMLISDADADGFHITGLAINFIDFLFPTLFLREKQFFYYMRTPLVKIGDDLSFYTLRDAGKYLEDHPRLKKKAKYIKGLGSNRKDQVCGIFGKRIVSVNRSEECVEVVNQAFHENYSDVRKKWIGDYTETEPVLTVPEYEIEPQSVSDFVHIELIKHSVANCKRTIPSLCDGLKESQRKILYSAFLKKLYFTADEVKIPNLAGHTVEKTNYHYGDQNLWETTIGMGQRFPGSNNIPILFDGGLFGSRETGGNDLQARYLFTKLELLTPFIFREEDFPLYERLSDEGDLIEWKFMVPIIPMILVNGCSSIATGWSSTVLAYNPLDLIEWIKTWIASNGKVSDSSVNPESGEGGRLVFYDTQKLIPWYRGWKGTIETEDEKTFLFHGVATPVSTPTGVATPRVYRISELPIGYWTINFVSKLDTLQEEKDITRYINNSDVDDINFTVTVGSHIKSIDKLKLGLTKKYSTSNMVLYDIDDRLKKFDTVEEILTKWCSIRYDYYVKRKKYQLTTTQTSLKFVNNKIRFMREIIEKKLTIFNVPMNELVTKMTAAGYDKKVESATKRKKEEEIDEKEEVSPAGNYGYLLKMGFGTATKEKLKRLEDEKRKLEEILVEMSRVTEKERWLNELNEFSEKYSKWSADEAKKEAVVVKKPASKKIK